MIKVGDIGKAGEEVKVITIPEFKPEELKIDFSF